MRLGIIARSDNTGLGNQTRELVNMLSPDKILLIDSTPFNNNKQHPEWYDQYSCIKTQGFPTVQQIKMFLGDVDVVLSCETFYDQNFIRFANRRGVKTILQYNYELFGHLANPELPLPNLLHLQLLLNYLQLQKIITYLNHTIDYYTLLERRQPKIETVLKP